MAVTTDQIAAVLRDMFIIWSLKYAQDLKKEKTKDA